MAAQRGERPGQFMYEPSYPPTIPPGQTIGAYRRGRPRRWRGGRRRQAPIAEHRERTPADEARDHVAFDLAAWSERGV
jgi:hypothetical protein